MGALIVLITTQVTRILAGAGHGPYLWTLAMGAAGFLTGELGAMATHAGGPSLGALHPVADVIVIAVWQVLGAALARPLSRRNRQP